MNEFTTGTLQVGDLVSIRTDGCRVYEGEISRLDSVGVEISPCFDVCSCTSALHVYFKFASIHALYRLERCAIPNAEVAE